MSEAPLPLAIVAAVARNRVIGGGRSRGHGLPWRLSSDLKRFRALTLGKPLVMGRRTFDAIGRVLPGRETIVLTRDAAWRSPGVHAAPTLDAALRCADAIGRRLGAASIIIAGGGELYAQTIGMAAALHLTEVDVAPDGDVLFPPIDPALWRETARSRHPASAGDEAAFRFVDYVRR